MSTPLLRRSSFLLATAVAALTFACTPGSDAANDDSNGGTSEANLGADGQAGSHVGVHGMTLFGSADKLYLSHIPLYSAPHNKQVIVEIGITAGVPADALATFNTNNFTVRPSAFSLFDLAAGTLTSVKGTIYFGNFESGGRPVYSNVTFSVKRVITNRAMGPATTASPSLDYVAVGTPANAYLVHVIDKTPSFDQVVSVKLPANSFLDAAALEAGTLVTITGGVNGISTRLAGGLTLTAEPVNVAPTHATGSSETPAPKNNLFGNPPIWRGVPGSSSGTVPPAPSKSMTVVKELGCLPGPEFFGQCPAVTVTH